MPVLRPLDLVLAASAKKRDTLQNVRETGEFVLNLAGADMADKVIPTARHSPPEEDEFVTAGLTERPSTKIKAPGIAGCYSWMECKLVKAYEEENFVLLLGQVLLLEVLDEVLDEEGALDVAKAKPLLMTGSKKGMHYCTAETLGRNDPFSAMFPEGKDPLAGIYKD
jgi:flavin reductase (DIM6/NTAB) family NADH-FMN oxidoreductase RutF